MHNISHQQNLLLHHVLVALGKKFVSFSKTVFFVIKNQNIQNGDDLADERDRRELILAQNELLQIVFTNQLFNEIVQSNRQLQTVITTL